MFLKSVPNLDMEALSQRVRRELAAVHGMERPMPANAQTPHLQLASASEPAPASEVPEPARRDLQPAPSLLVRVLRHLDPFRTRRLRDAERAEFWSRLEGLAGDLRALQHSVGQFSGLVDRIGQTQNQLAGRINDMQNQLTALGQRAAATNRSVEIMQGDVRFQNRRLARLDREGPGPSTRGPGEKLPLTPPDDLYLAFQDRFRGSVGEIKRGLRPHLDRIRGLPSLFPGRPLLDVGCGRGEWLELLSECGVEAYGIDRNPRAVDACISRGVEARHAEALTHLAGLPDGALGAITLFHVVEQLQLNEVLQLLEEARRTLVTTGLLIIETANPENIRVGASTFYDDPTHIRPIPPSLGQFLVESRGFVDVEIVRLNPYSDASLIKEESEAANRLNELMFGAQDYAILARKA